MAGNTDPSEAVARRRNELFFWAFAVAVLLIFLGRNALWTSEGRWAEIVREMIASGDYLHPSLNWQIYFDKPQLSYWLIVPFAHVLNGVNEFTVRLPSALAALVGLFGTVTLGKRLFDRQTALLGGWLLLGSYGFLFWGRTAAADMANLAAVTLAVAYFFQVEERAGFFHYLGFYLICFAGALAKGLPAVILPLALILPHLLAEKRWKRHLRFGNIAAFGLAAALYLTPFYLAKIVLPVAGQPLSGAVDYSGLQQVWRENVLNAFVFDADSLFLYFYSLPRVLLPWTLVIGVGIAGMIRQWKELPPVVRQLLVGTLLMFALFCAAGTRRWYYILPMTPFCALLGAAGMTRLGYDGWNRPALVLMRYLVIVAGSLCLASLIALPLWNRVVRVQPPGLLIAGLTAAGILSLIVMLLDNQPNMPVERLTGMPPRIAATVLGGAILIGTLFGCVLPSLTQFRTEKPFYLELKGALAGIPPDAMLFWQDNADEKYLFYLELREPVRDTSSRNPEENYAELRRFVADHAGKRVVIIAVNTPSELAELEQAAKRIGLKIDVQKPDYSEKPTPGVRDCSNKRVVWVLELPGRAPTQATGK